eukprot:UN00887
MDEVLVHFSEMKQQGFEPDTITYSAILNACDKCRDPRTAMTNLRRNESERNCAEFCHLQPACFYFFPGSQNSSPCVFNFTKN